jgi:hypothetical protein
MKTAVELLLKEEKACKFLQQQASWITMRALGVSM